MLKHHSAQRDVRPLFGGRLPRTLDRMVANPLFLVALLVDGAAAALQILALRFGDLSTVQPMLTLALVISLALDHVVSHTRPRPSEFGWAAVLITGLVLFLVSSGATHPRGGIDIGHRDRGLVLGLLALLAWGVALLVLRHAKRSIRARTLAVGVAGAYASAAGLIKSATRIFEYGGVGELATSWQLWTLIVVAGAGLVLNQQVFAMAPLHQTLPVIASLDPLFSVVIGRVVFDEQLLSTPLATVLETAGLLLLLLGVARLSRSQIADEAADERAGEKAAGADAAARPTGQDSP